MSSPLSSYGASLAGSWGKFFSRQDAHNAGASYKVANPDSRFVGAEAAWEKQWKEAEIWLLSAPEDYKAACLTATYHVDGTFSECLLWAHLGRPLPAGNSLLIGPPYSYGFYL